VSACNPSTFSVKNLASLLAVRSGDACMPLLSRDNTDDKEHQSFLEFPQLEAMQLDQYWAPASAHKEHA